MDDPASATGGGSLVVDTERISLSPCWPAVHAARHRLTKDPSLAVALLLRLPEKKEIGSTPPWWVARKALT